MYGLVLATDCCYFFFTFFVTRCNRYLLFTLSNITLLHLYIISHSFTCSFSSNNNNNNITFFYVIFDIIYASIWCSGPVVQNTVQNTFMLVYINFGDKKILYKSILYNHYKYNSKVQVGKWKKYLHYKMCNSNHYSS